MDSFIQVEADEPANEPLTADEIARQLRMSAAQQIAAADQLAMFAKAARQPCETFTQRRLINQRVNWLPARVPCGSEVLRLPFANVTEILSITYIDVNGVEQEMSVE